MALVNGEYTAESEMVYATPTGVEFIANLTAIGTTGTSYTVKSLTNGTQYGFLVRACINGSWTEFTTADNVFCTPSAGN